MIVETPREIANVVDVVDVVDVADFVDASLTLDILTAAAAVKISDFNYIF